MNVNTPQTIFSTDNLILGAGLAGIGYAYFTNYPFHILEKENYVGGVAASSISNGFTFDCTGHWLHLQHPEIKTLVEQFFPEGLLEIARRAEIHISDQRTPYPFQANTYNLPPDMRMDCVLGYFKAREMQAAGLFSPPKSFEEFIRQRMGDGIAEHFMLPYNTKMWTIPPSEMSYEWCGRFVPLPTPEEVLQGAFVPPTDGSSLGYNSTFFYPKTGGMGELPKRLSEPLAPHIELQSNVSSIDFKKRVVTTNQGSQYSYKRLVSTLPLPNLINTLVAPPPFILEAAGQLRSTSVTYWNLGFEGEACSNAPHWIYFPEEHIPFYRVGSPSAAVPHTAPKGHRSYYVETSHPTGSAAPFAYESILSGLKQVGLCDLHATPTFAEEHTIPCAYVIMDEAYGSNRKVLLDWLKEQQIWSVGRYGAWTYDSMEGALVQGQKLAQELNKIPCA